MKYYKISIAVLLLIMLICSNVLSQTKLVMDLYAVDFPYTIAGDQGNRAVENIGADAAVWVKVYLLNVSNLVGYQVKFSFDKTKLNWAGIYYTDTDPYSGEVNTLSSNMKITNINSDTTTFEMARSRGQNGTAVSVDTMWIATVKFTTKSDFTTADVARFTWERGQLEPKGQSDLETMTGENMEGGAVNGSPPTSVPDDLDPNPGSAPEDYNLAQNFPNPFNPETNIRFSLKEPGFVSLNVFNTLGREAAGLVNRNMSPGTYTVTLHAGSFVSGIYFYVLKVNDFTSVRKMTVLK